MPGRGARNPKVDEKPAPRDRTRGPVEGERRVAAWIGASIVIRGQVTSSEDMTIAGRVEGDVVVQENLLVIAPEGHIDGNVLARTVIVNGRVTGDVEAKQKIEVRETGSVFGDILAPRMTVAEGAVLRGHLSIAPAQVDGDRAARSTA